MEQQGASGWYGGSQQQQQQYGGHPHQHPHPHPSVPWQVRPETTQHYNQSAQMLPSQHQHQYQQAYPAPGGYYGQPAGYYASQQHQVPQAPAPQPVAPPPLSQQHGMMYGQAEQGWSSSNGWTQQQWPLAEVTRVENSTAGLSQEEEWAAKARAWAASKAQEAQQHSQLHVQTQPDQSSPESLQQLPLPPPPPPPPPQPVDLSQQFAYQAHEAGIPAYGHDNSQKYGQVSSGLFGRDASFRSRGEEMKSFASEGSTSSSGLTTTPGHPLSSTHRNISELGTSSYSQDLISSHGQTAPPADFTVPPGMEQLETPQPPAPPPPAAASLPHLPHPQPPQLPSQISPHQQTGHMQSHLPPSQFSFGEPSVPASYDFHQQPPYEFQQSQSQDYLHPQPSQFNMSADVPEAGVYNGLSHPQSWPPQMPYPTNNVGPGIGAGPGLGHQFEYEFEHMHPGHQHPQHLQGHTMFARPPHGPGFRPGGPPIGHFSFGNNPTLGPGAGAGMDFSMFTDNGHGLNAGIDRPKKASVPNWLKEELLKKKAAVGGSAQLTTVDDNPRANGDNIEPSTHNKFDISDRSRSDLSRMSDSDEEDEEDDTEAARTMAMNQEIKRVLTEVLLKVTDDLFDEIAQEVMDEDEQRLIEDPSKKASLAEESAKHPTPNAPVLESASALAPAPVRVLVASAVKLSEDDSDDDSKSLSSGAPAGNLLGLASYASDDEEAGRDSRQATESKHRNGGNSDTEASELKSFAAEKAGELMRIGTEDQVVIAKEVKGKKRLSGEVLNSSSSGRSPRRARHSEVSGGEAGQSIVSASINPGVPVHKVGAIDVEDPDLGTAVEGEGLQTAHVKEVTSEIKANHKTPPLNASSTERRKLEGGIDHSSKGRSDEDSSHLRRAEKEAILSDKHKHGVDIDVGKTIKERSHVNAKQGAMEAEGDGDHKNGIKREKDTNKSVKGRGREDKEKDRDREGLSGKERERSVQKIKQRERELDVEKHKEREKDKDRGRSTKARGRDSDREKRKSVSEKHDRKSTDHKKDKDKNSKKTRRRRSSSLSSRSRSRSRSESNSASGSRSSSASPRRGKQQRGRSSKKPTHSSPPSRSRRRTSRSPSRSVPHSKVSHRRNSPSLSREKERNRKSRSTSPGHKRRRR